jgi:REP element-mobilizing transposase RayT
MARPLRLEFSGALYHVTSRGNCLNDIYRSDTDREDFLRVFSEVCARCHWRCYAYCLMDNHYHLLFETPEANLSKGMRQLNGVYTQRFNRAHAQVGHVFQGRYKAILVDKVPLLLDVARHIVLNPVRVGAVSSAQDWEWSSYRATIGKIGRPVWLETEEVLAGLGAEPGLETERYAQFIEDGLNQPSVWTHLSHQVYLGDTRFVERMQAFIDRDKALDEIPLPQRRPPAKPLEDYERAASDRNEAIVLAYASGGYTLKEVGNYFKLHYSTVSGIVRNSRNKG